MEAESGTESCLSGEQPQTSTAAELESKSSHARSRWDGYPLDLCLPYVIINIHPGLINRVHVC